MEIAIASAEQSEQREKDLQNQLQTIQNDYQLLQQERNQLETAINIYTQREQEQYKKEEEWIDTEKELKIFNSLKEAKVKSLEQKESELRELLLRERAKFGVDRDVMEKGWETKMVQLRQQYEDKLEKLTGRSETLVDIQADNEYSNTEESSLSSLEIEVNGENADVGKDKVKLRRISRVWRRIKSSANIFRKKK